MEDLLCAPEIVEEKLKKKKKQPLRNLCGALSKVLSQTAPSFPFFPPPLLRFLLFGYSVVPLPDVFLVLFFLCFFGTKILTVNVFPLIYFVWIAHDENHLKMQEILQMKYECNLFAVVSCDEACQCVTSADSC